MERRERSKMRKGRGERVYLYHASGVFYDELLVLMEVGRQGPAREVSLKQHVCFGVWVGVLRFVDLEGEVHGEFVEHSILAVAHWEQAILSCGAQNLNDTL